MAKRDEVIPEDLVTYLQKAIPGYKQELPQHQWALARMVWQGGSKRRQHQYFAGAMSFHYKELEEAFGRGGFTAVNKRLGFFEYTNNWSKVNGYTKGYKFSELVNKKRESYLDRIWRRETRLLMVNGSVLKTLPAAVASKDMRGITTKAWREAKELNKVRVDLVALRRLSKWLRRIRDDWREGRTPSDLVTDFPSLEVIERLANMTSQVIRLAKTDVAGHGYIAQRYVEATSGRLYARGINLQTAPTLIKQAALSGLWEYDFSNCHFDILRQMAAEHGYQCKAISHYLDNKKAVRQTIADQAGITENQAKTCLLAILYGARASEWHESAIPEEIGQEGARRLNGVPLFQGLLADIKGARAAILKGHKRTANGSLSNIFGKAISGDEKPPEQLAHLIQGVEAKALKAAIDLYPNDIVLLQHDGFAATRRLSCQDIVQAVEQATGYRLNMEEELIQVHPDAYFLRNRIQSENA